MTVSALYKKLQIMIVAGHGRRRVVINKRSFTHPLESDGCCMLDIVSVSTQVYNKMNDDGGFLDENGNEKFMRSVVLSGEEAPAPASKEGGA
jgi:hypothetical protein